MFELYKRLRVSKKLLISSLVFALPITVLGVFLDMGFLYDINITRTEDNGIAYIRLGAPVLDKIPHYILAHGNAVKPNHFISNKHIHQEVSEINDIFIALNDNLSLVLMRHTYMPHSTEAKEVVKSNLKKLNDIWMDIRDNGGTPEKYRLFLNQYNFLVLSVGDSTMINLDPVLDSNYLAEVVIKGVPSYIQRLSEVAVFAENAFLENNTIDFNRVDKSRIYDFIINLESIAKDHIERSSEIALREDEHYYGTSPTLQENYRIKLAEYKKAKQEFCDILRGLLTNNAVYTKDHFVNAWLNAHKSALFLNASGTDELEILIGKRRESYMYWRLMSFSIGSVALFVALFLVYSISRGIIKPVSAITEYTRKVSRGDYDAAMKGEFSGEFSSLSSDIRKMVEELKLRLAYTEGILDSIVAPFIVTDKSEQITFVNPAMVRLLEYREQPEYFIGSNLHAFFRNNASLKALSELCLKERICVENEEAIIQTETGEARFVNVFISPLYDPDGKLIGATSFIVDLTDLKKREKEIDLLAAFPRENPSPVLAADKNGHVYYRNTATDKILKHLNMDIMRFLPPEHMEIVSMCLSADRRREDYEYEVGGRIYTWTYHPLKEHDTVQIHGLDITDRKRIEEQLLHDAFHDALTGLPNRALFLDRLNQMLSHVKKSKDDGFCILFLDLDRFKVVNDSLGHTVGDALLNALSDRMKSVLDTDDTLARLGGDEYVVLLPTASEISVAVKKAQYILDAVSSPIVIYGYDLSMSASIGIVSYTEAHDTADDLLRDADTAMYRAKALGKNRYEIFDDEMHRMAKRRLELELELRTAVDKKQFAVYYQPLICLKTGTIQGFEALVRWMHPERGVISPAEFIPLAEETGLIIPMGLFVLEKACRKAQEWRVRYNELDSLMMSVNLSVKQFSSSTLVGDIRNALNASGLPPENLKLELTESGIMENAKKALSLLKELIDMNVKLSIDDFGTGYSSLSYLTRFPFHYLKVDQSFVRGLEKEPENMSIIKTIVALAHDMKKKVIAEGIETEFHYQALKSLHTEYGQGYYFSKPIPENDIETLLKQNPKW